jgi:periplasmic divalent cation tolerance protein
MRFSMVYITAKDKGEAKAIGKCLLEERLAACVNIINNMNSMYWWKGKIEEANEAILIAKTKDSLVSKLIEKVKSMHSYECPCIVSLPIQDGYKPFLDWIKNETKGGRA